jgi:hypothetical protein
VHGRVDSGPLRGRAGGRLETEARLDLTEAGAAAVLRDLFQAVRPAHPDRLSAAARLARSVARRGRLDVRLYTVDRAERRSGRTVAGLGRRVDEVTQTASLVAAFGREPGGGWERRLDCGVDGS